MDFVAVFFVLFFFLAIVVGPWLRVEDRPDFKWPNRKARKMTTPLRRES